MECGVFNGAGLFTWASLSEIYEPINHSRKIIGFDTFEGFPCVGKNDNLSDFKSSQGDLGDRFESISLSVTRHESEGS